MLERFTQIDRDRLSIITGALVLALALTRFLEIPIRPLVRTTIFGSPLGFNLSATTIMLLIILGMSVTGVASLIRGHPLVRLGKREPHFIFWIVPALFSVAVALWLNRIQNPAVWTAVLLAGAILILWVLIAEYTAVSPKQRQAPLWQWSQMALVHLTAVILFTLVYHARVRSLVSGTAVLIIAVLLSARFFWSSNDQPAAAFTYGGVVGLILGQMTWVLNYWRLTDLQGGLLLLLLFYVIVGLIQQFLQGQFGRRIVLEYGGVAVLVLLLIVLTPVFSNQ
jgi:hypothetical protein